MIEFFFKIPLESTWGVIFQQGGHHNNIATDKMF